jgi:hypothetical protein
MLLPATWVFSFYQNLTAMRDTSSGLIAPCKTAARQASIYQRQAFLLAGILFIFGLFVWLNVLTAMAALPFLLRTLLGVDTAFTRAGAASVLNTTCLACSFALTYICFDPLIKAVYVLRCYYGESVDSGDDLKVELALEDAPAQPPLSRRQQRP